MRFTLYKMTRQGKIAFAILAVLGVVCVIQLIAFPGGSVDMDRITPAKYTLLTILEIAHAILTFPLGWLSQCGSFESPPCGEALLAPLNAYFWGFVVGRPYYRFVRKDSV